VQALIRDGHVLVNGRAARAALRVRGGDHVRIELPALPPASLEPEAIPLVILHEDDALIVVNKPAGLVVHPGAGVPRGTLVHALLHHDPAIAAVGGAGRPGIVHRLDKDTSGLLVVARTGRAYRALIEAMGRREVARRYRALVWGEPRADQGTIDGAIGRDPRHRQRMAVLARGGRPARTGYRVAERFGPAAALEVALETGRTHQIRVHLAHRGHPVVGDPVYGGRSRKLLSLREPERSLAQVLLGLLARQALHASELELRHPVTGQKLHFTAPLPDDFAAALDRLRAFRDSRRG
jgi:23S rRNA pseudouridine1911/1915/1917 synthase